MAEHQEHHEGTESRLFRRVLLGWMILFSVAIIFGFWQLSGVASSNKHNLHEVINTKASNAALTQQLNQVSQAGCLNSIPILSKFNGLVSSIIAARQGQLALAREQGDKQAIKVHLKAIARYKSDYLQVPTVAQCKARHPFGRRPAPQRPN